MLVLKRIYRVGGILVLLSGIGLVVAVTAFALGNIVTIDSEGNVGYEPSVVLTSDNRPVIAYTDSTNKAAKLILCNNPACTTHTGGYIEGNLWGVHQVRLKAGDLPVVLYQANGLDMKVFICANQDCSQGTSKIAVPDDNSSTSGPLNGALALTPSGIPVVAYTQLYPHAIRVARCSDSLCSSSTSRAIEADYSSQIALRLTTAGNPMLAYTIGDFQGGNDVVRFVVCGDPACVSRTIETLDQSESIRPHISLQLTTAGLPVLSYYDVWEKVQKIMICHDVLCDDSTIKEFELDNFASVGDHALALTSDDRPVVSYYADTFDEDLRLAVCSDPLCTTITDSLLDSLDRAGYRNDLVLTPDDLPVVAYYERLQEDLKLYTLGSETMNLSLTSFNGRPGSVFTLQGSGLPANADVTVRINGTLVATGLSTDSSGVITRLLDTAAADPGFYSVQLQVDTGLGLTVQRQAIFLLADNLPLRTATVTAPLINVPAAIGVTAHPVYLPLVKR